jgi:hypothetical protein
MTALALNREFTMSDKPKEKHDSPKAETKKDTKTAETVNLSAEELRKISGGATAPGGGTIQHGSH